MSWRGKRSALDVETKSDCSGDGVCCCVLTYHEHCPEVKDALAQSDLGGGATREGIFEATSKAKQIALIVHE